MPSFTLPLLRVSVTSAQVIMLTIGLTLFQADEAAAARLGEVANIQYDEDRMLGLERPCFFWMLATAVLLFCFLIAVISGRRSLKWPCMKKVEGSRGLVDDQTLASPGHLSLAVIMAPIISVALRAPVWLPPVRYLLICAGPSSIIWSAQRMYDERNERIWWTLYLLSGSLCTYGVLCIDWASRSSLDAGLASMLVSWACAGFVATNLIVLGIGRMVAGTQIEQPAATGDGGGEVKEPPKKEKGTPPKLDPRKTHKGRVGHKEGFHRLVQDVTGVQR